MQGVTANRDVTRAVVVHGRSVLWLAAGVILFTGIAAAAALGLLRSQMLEEARSRNDALAHTVEEQTARTLQTVDLQLQIAAGALAGAASGGTLGDVQARALLREQISQLPFVRAMWVLDVQGRIVYDSDTGNLGTPLGDRPYFVAHQPPAPARLYVGVPVISRTTGGWMINLSRPLATAGVAFGGVIVAALRPEWFSEVWSSVGFGSGDAVALARSDGVLLMRSPMDDAAIGQSQAAMPAFRPPMADAASGRFEVVSPVDGVRRMVAFRNLSTQPDLRVLVGLERDALLAPWRRLATVTAASWVALAAMIGMLGWRTSRNLTRRFAAEQAARSSTEKLNLALSGSDLGLWDWDAPSGRMVVNERWLTMLGLDPKGPSPTLEDWHARVHPDDMPKLERLLREVILAPAGRDFDVAVRARHADGHHVWILDRGAVVERDADGHPLRVAGTHLDITERKHAEQILLESKNFNASVIDSLRKQIAVLDAHGVIVAVNEAWHRSAIGNGAPATLDGIGIGADYLAVCEKALDSAQGEDARQTQAGIRAVLAGELAEFHLEYPCHSSTGQHWFQMNVAPMRGAAGGVVVSHTDITEQKLAAVALRDSEARYRELFDSSPQPMWVFDTATKAFLAVNIAAVRQYGYSHEEFLAMTIWDIRPPEEALRLRKHLEELGASRPDSGGWIHRRKDGQLIQVEIATHGLDYGHRPSRLVLATDVTARERAEAERARLNTELERHRLHLEDLIVGRTQELAAAREQAEEANRAKSAFLANMSHEIRTPLNAIVGLNYLVRRDPITPAQAARLEKIDAAGVHLLSIINDVLDLSKIEAGRVQIEVTNFHLSSVLDSVQSLIGEAACAKGLIVRIDGNAVPVWLRGDPTRLRQALLNFASNAVKFTEQGSISLRAKLLSDEGDQLLVRFAVEDTGIGITPEQLPRLFQAFEQADASITRKFGGTGLGLTISQRLAGLMGGECGVDSQAGVGSTFWFTARLRRGHGVMPSQEQDDSADAEMQLRQRHRGARILLAEDNGVNLEVALAMLHGVGMYVDTAIDGREAVRLAAAGAYDLVLMDMQMPEMGGLEATRVIRAMAGWQTRPILALTANAFDDDRQACAAAGMNDFITKPMRVHHLYETMLHWLDAGAGSSGDDRGVAGPPRP